MQDEEVDDIVSPPTKRPRLMETRMIPRKRAVAACQVCRTRKTKCDNERPSCGTCLSLGVACQWPDRSTDLSSFDSASLVIIDRLNYALQLLETQGTSVASLERLLISENVLGSSLSVPSTNPVCFNTPTPITSLNTETLFDGRTESPVAVTEALNASNCGACHRVLEWPIFNGRTVPKELFSFSFGGDQQAPILTPESLASPLVADSNFRAVRPGRGIREDDVPQLVEDFLQNVHTKHPVLDPAVLIEMGHEVVEHGFKWDGPSCLLHIVCALASLAMPFQQARLESFTTTAACTRDYSTAEQYYVGARKRIGLVQDHFQSVQCHFLLGIYEMYSMRPLKAWLSFSHASVILQVFLRSTDRQSDSQSVRRLEQRLYWSCLKSECEMREEMDLPATGLAQIDYPASFPSPPGSSPAAAENRRYPNTDHLETVFQRSWYYYLSEIAVRRLLSRVSVALYHGEPGAWLSTPISYLNRITMELDTQVLQWAEHIPAVFKIDEDSVTDELSWNLRGRFLSLRAQIWRPYLFIVIHGDSHQVSDPINVAYAKRCLQLTLQGIDHLILKYRHHGTWLVAKNLCTKALSILAAVKGGKMMVEEDWASRIDQVCQFLQMWENEAPDLKVARLMLKDIEEEVRMQANV